MNELSQTLIADINECHQRVTGASLKLKDSVIESINSARETGIKLLELKQNTKHGEWLPLFKSHHGRSNASPALHFSDVQGLTYMRIANALKEGPITDIKDGIASLKDFLVATEIITLGNQDGQHIHNTNDPYAPINKALAMIQQTVDRALSKSPIDEWSPPVREALKGRLEPLVKLYNEL